MWNDTRLFEWFVDWLGKRLGPATASGAIVLAILFGGLVVVICQWLSA